MEVEPFVAMFRDATSPLERLVASGDAQAHGLVAADPTIGSPALYGAGDAALAYRAQRPFFGMVAWVLSGGGQRDLVPLGVALAWVVGGAVLGAGAALVSSVRWAAAAVAVALLLSSRSPVAEPMLVGVLLLALHRSAAGRPWSSAALFGIAGLLKEVGLLVAAAVALQHLRRGAWRDAVVVSSSALPYVVWVGYLRLRVGAWPWEAGTGRLGRPLGGAIEVQHWDVTDFTLSVVFLALAWMVWRTGPGGRWIVGLHAVLLAVSGDDVWSSARNLGRVALPVLILGLLLPVATARGGRDLRTLTGDGRKPSVA